MSPGTRERTPASMSPTTYAQAQARFDARDPEVFHYDTSIRPVRARRDEQFSCLRAATSISSRLYDRGLLGSWKRNISVVLSPGFVLLTPFETRGKGGEGRGGLEGRLAILAIF